MGQPYEQPSRHDPELAGLFAVGALDDPEKAAFEAHLAACAVCASIVAEDRATLRRLLLASPEREPSPGFKERLMQRAAQLQAESFRGGTTAPKQGRARWRIERFALVAALVVALGVGALLGQAWYGEQVLTTVRLAGSATPVVAQVVVRRSGAVELDLDGLPDPGAGKVYEAWVIPPGRQPSAAGTASSGQGTIQVNRGVLGDTVALTVENAPGNASRSTPPIVSGAVAT